MYQLEELSIEISNKCLCRCIHCSSGSQPKAGKDELEPFGIVCLINEARNLGATVLSLSGGDPILYDQDFLGTFIQQAVKIGYERILFYTTGIWEVHLYQIDTPGCEPLGGMWGIDSWSGLPKLMDVGGSKLTFVFSLHSHRPEVHDFIMGLAGSWNTITGGILALQDYKMKYSLGYDVEVHMVPMRPNYRHISNVRDMCQSLGVSKLSLLRFVPQTRGFSNTDMLSLDVEAFQWMQHQFDYEMTGRRSDHAVELRLGCPIDFRHTVGATVSGKKVKPCHAGTDLILVRPDGSVHPCAAWKTLPDDSNVRDASLMEIWENGKVFQELRIWHEGGYQNPPYVLDDDGDPNYFTVGGCGACFFLDSCKGGCPAQKLHAYGKTLDAMYYPASDPLCPIGG